MKNLYQRIEDGTNVIVELESSTNIHHSRLDKPFKNARKLSDDEIIELSEANMTKEQRLDFARNVVKKLDGFGITQSSNDKIGYGDIVEFETIIDADGHITLIEDVAADLNRKSYLEKRKSYLEKKVKTIYTDDDVKMFVNFLLDEGIVIQEKNYSIDYLFDVWSGKNPNGLL